jgi:D-tagatose-1,6-bisphosphate aldolase subunit GatZ/KbaZ
LENAISNLVEWLAKSRRQGRSKGIYSVRSAHTWVLEAAIDQALEFYMLIEANLSQVNQLAGSARSCPKNVVRFVPAHWILTLTP